MEVGVVHTPARFSRTAVPNERLGVVGVPQVPDDVPHVAQLTVGRGDHGLHADQTAVRAGAVTLAYSGQQVRRCPLHHVAGPHLDTAGHGGGLVARHRHRLHHSLVLLVLVQVAPGDLDQQDGDDDHEQQQDGDDADGHGYEVLHLHLHHQRVAPVGLHPHGVVGRAPSRLVLGGAEEGSVLRQAGVGDEELTPGAQTALLLLHHPHPRVVAVHQQAVVAPAHLGPGLRLDSAHQGDVPPLPHRDEHGGGRDRWQTGQLLGAEGGDGEPGQSVRALTDGLVEAGHVGLHQPVPQQAEPTVAVPGVPGQRDSVEAGAQLERLRDHP